MRTPLTRAALATAAFAAALVLLLSTDTARAGITTIAVTRTDDPVPGACEPDDCSLREAVIASNASPGAEMIELGPGVYTLAIAGPGEDAAHLGDLDLSDAMIIQGAGNDATFVDAGEIDRAFEASTFAELIELRDLTVENGLDVDGRGGGAVLLTAGGLNLVRTIVRDSRSDNGGAIRVTKDGSLQLTDSAAIGNEATDSGGAISVAGAMALQRSRLEGNVAGSNGGGIASYGQGALIGINDSLVARNEAAGDGGAVYADSAFIGANGSDLVDNVAADGGGALFVFGTLGVGGSLTISESLVSGNRAEGSGGAIHLSEVSLLVSTDNIVDSNQAGGDGGGVYLAPTGLTGQTRIEDTTISGNTAAGTGGGIHILTSGAPGMLVAASTIDSNASASDGGGVYLTGPGQAIFRNLTVSGNTAGAAALTSAPGGAAATGGGIFDGSEGGATFEYVTVAQNQAAVAGGYHNAAQNQTVRATIVADNAPGDCGGPAVPSLGSNLDSDGTCGLAGPMDVSSGNAGLVPLADNGGPTRTHALLPGSGAIDAGNLPCPLVDQRGAPRPFDGDGDLGARCDIGSFEFGASPPVAPPPFFWGDDDCDSAVAATDALKKLQHVASIPYQAEPGCPAIGSVRDTEPAGFGIIRWGDTDCDGDADSVDALQILRHLAGLSVSQLPLCPAIGSALFIN